MPSKINRTEMAENTDCPRYVALAGDGYVESADDLDSLLALLADLHDPDSGEDVVIWNDFLTVAALLLHDGSTLILEGEKAGRRLAKRSRPA